MNHTKGLETMAILEKITEDIKVAMKAGEKERVNALRFLLAKIKDVGIYKNKQVTDDDAISIIASSVKSRMEEIENYTKGNRPDLVRKEEQDIKCIKIYLPEALTPEALEAVIKETMAEAQALGPKDTGKVMKLLMPKVKGKADGKAVNEAVGKMLAALVPAQESEGE